MNTDLHFNAEYKKDPYTVSFEISALKNGHYHIEGEASAENWAKACEQMNVKAGTPCVVDIVLTKKSYALQLSGSIQGSCLRECVRTLKEFEETFKFSFSEEIYFKEREDDEDFHEILDGDVFSVGEYVNEQIILNLNPYPVHPSTTTAKDGQFDLLDGQEERINKEKEEKNPFSVLKGLKS